MSTARLPNLSVSPPGEWRYVVPETGQSFKGSNWPQLLDLLTNHYRASGYKMPETTVLFDRVEAYICANAPDYCVGTPASAPRFPLGHSFTNVLAGTKTLVSWLVGGRHYVPQAQANERAKVCSTCVFNTEPEGCTGCNAAVTREAVALVVGKRSTPLDARLKACRICSCQLWAKVHLPLDAILKHMPVEQLGKLPPHCWINTERKSESTLPI